MIKGDICVGKLYFKQKANILKVLAHATRLMILEELAKGVKCVNDIEELLETRQPNISQHLAILRYGGLVDFHQRGKKRCYFLTRPEMVKTIIKGLKKNRR